MALTLEQKITSEMATAMLNENMARVLASRCSTSDLVTRCAAAITASGAVVGYAAHLPERWQWLWKASLVSTALLTAISPVLRLDEHSRKWRELGARWTTLAGRCRTLIETPLAEDERQRRYLQLMEESETLHSEDVSPRRGRLIQRSEQLVRQRLGLPAPS